MDLYIISSNANEFSVAAITVAENSKVLFTSKIWTKISGPKKIALATLTSAIGQYLQVVKDPNINIITNDKLIESIARTGISISEKSEYKNLRILYLELTQNVKLSISEEADTNIIDDCVSRLIDNSEGIEITDQS